MSISDREILIVSPATTAGWRANEEELAGSLRRLDVPHRVRRIRIGPSRHLRRSGWWPLVDAVESVAAWRTLRSAVAESEPAAVVLMSSTAALLAPVDKLETRGVRVAIRIDCPAAVNRSGPQNTVQRALERRRIGAASLVIATGPRSAALAAPLGSAVAEVPVAIGSGSASERRGDDVVTYVDDPETKGLDLVCRAWDSAGERGGALHVTGVDPERARRFLRARGIAEPAGMRWHGPLSRERHLELVRAAAAYVSASRWECGGIAQLEALAAGVPLVTTPARGAYEAEPIARRLSPDLVTTGRDSAALERALAVALAMPADHRAKYAAEASRLMEPFGREATDRAIRDEVLPALFGDRA